jgi:4-amino-4-deoxy-L-arabinose transferase-like glycosyltransferase
MKGAARLAISIVVISTILKASLWAFVSLHEETRFLRADSGSYIEPARALARYGVFAVSPDRPTLPETIRTPGYPVFLAMSFRVFGERIPPAVLLQIGISVLVLGALYRLALDKRDTGVGIVAVTLLALDFASFTHSVLVLTETLFTLLLLSTLLAIRALLEERRVSLAFGWSVAAGLLLTAATYTRPVTYYLGAPVAMGLAVAVYLRDHRAAVAVGAAAFFLVAHALPIHAWQERNRRLVGASEFSAIVGLSMLHYRAAAVVALRDRVSLDEARRRLAPEGSFNAARDHPQLRLGERWRMRASRILVEHPMELAQVQAAGTVRMMASPGVGDLVALLGDATQRQASGEATAGVVTREQLMRRVTASPLAAALSIVAMLHLAVVYAGVAAWAYLVASRRLGLRAAEVLLTGVILYLIVTQAGPEAYARMRVPMMPLLAVLAAVGLTELSNRRRSAAIARGASSR